LALLRVELPLDGFDEATYLGRPVLLIDPITGSHLLVPKLRPRFTQLDIQLLSSSTCPRPPLAGANGPVECLVRSWTPPFHEAAEARV